MRKWVFGILGLLLLLLLIGYLLLPASIRLSENVLVAANSNALIRRVQDPDSWKAWWPGKSTTAQNPEFIYHDFRYRITDVKLHTVEIELQKGALSFRTELNLIPLSADTVRLNWEASGSSTGNRFNQFLFSEALQSDMKRLLAAMRSYYSQPDQLYGLKIREEHVQDSLLMSTYTRSKGYPSMTLVYGLLDELSGYVQRRGARQTGTAMLNLLAEPEDTYLVRVALPVDRKLADSGRIAYKWMLGGGNILVADVKGGPQSIARGFTILEQYAADHQRVAPAIPFQSLVTDRRQEPDTSQWITRLFFPVM